MSALLLDPEPQSVRRARAWIADRLEDLGRPELTDSAELGISELVTNAILHADPPITVRIGGTPLHPRVEVHDNSRRPPAVHTDMVDDEKLLRTVGRGLGIVAMYSSCWGAELSPDGKVVWFEPATEPNISGLTAGFDVELDDELAELLDEPPGSVSVGDPDTGPDSDTGGPRGDLFDLAEAVDELMAVSDVPEQLVPLRLVGMPAQVFASYRVWYAEIRRELRLLAFSHPEEYTVAGELTEITLRVEQERRHARGVDELDAAIAAGRATVDLDYLVPPSAGETMGRLRDLLERVDDFCREHRLLTMPATPQQVALRRWYFGEFTRQVQGLAPVPWPGSYEVEPPLS